jgi:hypothetical protein
LVIGVLSLVPGTLRPETGAPGQFEHFVAYLGAATFLALGSNSAGQRWQSLWLVRYAAALETLNFSFRDAILVSRILRSALLGQLLELSSHSGLRPSC